MEINCAPSINSPPYDQFLGSTQEILLCGPASVVNGFIDEHPCKLLIDTGASMSIVNETFQHRHFSNIVLRPGDVNATSVTGDPVNLREYFRHPLG